MFDVGFSELLLIGVIALIVLGPERLPKVARTVGALLGRLNRYASQVKQDIDREIKLEELRKVQKDMQESAQKYEIIAGHRVQEVEAGVLAEVAQVDQALQGLNSGVAVAATPVTAESSDNPAPTPSAEPSLPLQSTENSISPAPGQPAAADHISGPVG